MRWRKLGLIFEGRNAGPRWKTHCMAPAPILLDDATIRVYLGGWDAQGISRIHFLDLDAQDPTRILHVESDSVLELGEPGTFDDNGMFPGHVAWIGGRIHLHYTGFQLGEKIRYFNFGGLAVSDDGRAFLRHSRAPILDRSEEGLHVRAGQSVIEDGGLFRSCYSAGTGWCLVGDRMRPTYDVFYQESADPRIWKPEGRRILSCDPSVEHGLGRPQLIRMADEYCVFYTRRMIAGMRYHMGMARSPDCRTWTRADESLGLPLADSGFDSEMAYFPAVLRTASSTYLFYSGNGFGYGGMGCAVLEGKA